MDRKRKRGSFESLFNFLMSIDFNSDYAIPAISAHLSKASSSLDLSSPNLTPLSLAELPRESTSSSSSSKEATAKSTQRSTDQTLRALDSAHLSPSENIVQGFAARSESRASNQRDYNTETAAEEESEEEPDTYVSKVRILPTSLPHLWKEYMAEHKKSPQAASAFAIAMNAPHSTAAAGLSAALRPIITGSSIYNDTTTTSSSSTTNTSSTSAIASPSTPNPMTVPSFNPTTSPAAPSSNPNTSTSSDERRLSNSQDVERARSALRPHARPALVPSDIVKIDADKVPRTEKKPGQKWMFGIRSRNTAAEAIHCVYRALKGMGCMWEVEPGRPGDLSNTQALGKQAALPWNYVPPEGNLWSIRVVWQKDSMAPPGAPPNWKPVAEKAARDLPVFGKDGVVIASPEGRRPDVHGVSPTVEGSIRVWNEIQVFESEGKETTKIYTVDIRCEGYEPFVVGDDGRVVPRGWMRKEKDVTDPFPFIDFANRLIVELTS